MRRLIHIVLTPKNEQHPWAKYYAKRGVARLPVANLAPPSAARPRKVQAPVVPVAKPAAMSADLAAAVATVTAQAMVPGVTAAPFITAMQKQAVQHELRRRSRLRIAKWAALVVFSLAALHLTVTHTILNAPSDSALEDHVQNLPELALQQLSSVRQPLQSDGVEITQKDQIDDDTWRCVASVTLRLRKPLYVPASTNGTENYRRAQESLPIARDQEMRFSLFSTADRPELPVLPNLLQRSHQEGEAIVVRVPFTARRFGWGWRLATPPMALHTVDRVLEGDSLDRYSEGSFMVYGDPASLAEIRRRVKQAQAYVISVAKAVQSQAQVVAVAAPPAADSVADVVAVAAESSDATEDYSADSVDHLAGSGQPVASIVTAASPTLPLFSTRRSAR